MAAFIETHSGELTILALILMVLATLMVIVPQLLRANLRKAEMAHLEHLKALEQGRPIPLDDNRSRMAARLALLVPMVVMIAAYILIFIVMLIFGLIFGAALGGAGAFSPGALESGAVGGGALFVGIILYVALIVFLLWVQGRFIVAGPIMADRLTRNPITGLSESWRLTQASQWVIVGFYVVFAILVVVYMLVVGMIVGGIFGSLAGGSMAGAMISLIVSAAVIYLPLIMVSFSVPIGIYRAIAPKASADVFA